MSTATMKPVGLGIAGLGGYANAIRQAVMRLGQDCQPQLRLAAVCEPRLEAHAGLVDELRQAGVHIHRDLPAMLGDDDVEAVWLPVPIDLHRSFTEQALAAGKAVMCEKPAAGVLQDVDAMLAARDRAGKPVAVGYQSLYEPRVWELKRRLLSGELGRITHATVYALRPRDSHYYTRSGWAGKLKRSQTWVLDSPANNAIAHHLHLPLFLLGRSLDAPAVPVRLEAELYRAASIETYDTCSFRVHMSDGATLLVIFSHACPPPDIAPTLMLMGERGRVHLTHHDCLIHDAVGRCTPLAIPLANPLAMLDRFSKLARGIEPPGPLGLATLEMSRAHALVVSAASQAAAVTAVPADQIEEHQSPTAGVIRAIKGIQQAVPLCIQRGQMLHESGLLPFTASPAVVDLTRYTHFSGPAAPAARE